MTARQLNRVLPIWPAADPRVDGPEPWMERALCKEIDGELFFAERGDSTSEAKNACRGCEVRSECLEYALNNDEKFGVWGGLSERERRKLKRRQEAA